jgi:hypothetical protein
VLLIFTSDGARRTDSALQAKCPYRILAIKGPGCAHFIVFRNANRQVT